MSANRSNEWKVGAFVVGGVVAAVATLFWLGASRFNTETIERVTFLDESVQGLEVGAPVKVRGVTIGKVTEIRLAQDRRLVEVHASLRVEAMRALNVLDRDDQADDQLPDVPMDLRFTMASQGITGIKFLEADFFPESAPTIEVPFDPPPGFVPATPSTLKSLEDALRGLADDVPKALADFRRLTATVDRKLNELDTERLSTSISTAAEDLSSTLERADPTKLMGETEAMVQDLRAFVGDLDRALVQLTGAEGVVEQGAEDFKGLVADVRALVASAGDTLQSTEALLQDADLASTTASLRGAADSTSALARSYEPTGAELAATLVEVRRTLKKIEELAGLLDRDPGVLLRGRSPNPSR